MPSLARSHQLLQDSVPFCPSYSSTPEGFIVSHLPHGLVEVSYDGEFTKEVRYRKSGAVDEELYYRGLISTFHSTHDGLGHHSKPLTDLAVIFPLEVGKQYHYDMEVSFSGRVQRIETTRIDIQSTSRTKVGNCAYQTYCVAVTLSPPGSTSMYCFYSPELRRVVSTRVGSHALGKGVMHPRTQLPQLLEQLKTSRGAV